MSLVTRWADQRIGPGDQDGGHVHHVGGQPGGIESPQELRRRDEHLASHVAALLLAGKLVLEVHARRAGLDHRLHDLERVERAAEAGLGVGDDGGEVVDRVAALGVLDLVGPAEGVVDGAHQGRRAVAGVQALVGIHLPGEVGVGRDLPAAEIDRLQACLDHLDCLVAGDGAQGGHERLGVQQLPEPLGAPPRQGGLDVHRAAEPGHLLRGVISPASLPARVSFPPVAQFLGTRRTVALHDQSLPIKKTLRRWAPNEAGTPNLACRNDDHYDHRSM